jgi:hypothetical protein
MFLPPMVAGPLPRSVPGRTMTMAMDGCRNSGRNITTSPSIRTKSDTGYPGGRVASFR